MTQVVTATNVRDMIGVDTNTGQWGDTAMNAHIVAAQDAIEHGTGRWFVDRPATTFTTTTNGRAQVYVPGFRTVTGVTLQGSTLSANASFWAIPDTLSTGIYIAIQTRAFTSTHRDFSRPWLANPEWFDRNLDSPYFPGNYGGGWSQGSLPNDLVVSGDGGYLTANLPGQFLDAVKFLAAFYAERTASLLADVAITPAGGVLNYSEFQREADRFINTWKIGEQAVSI
jgi:hypothetical protein